MQYIYAHTTEVEYREVCQKGRQTSWSEMWGDRFVGLLTTVLVQPPI